MNQTANSWVIKLTLLLTSTLTIMAGATIAPSLPAMQTYFADVENAQFWVRLLLTVPALFIAIGAPIAGQLVDTLGRKSLLLVSALLYGAAGSSGFILNSLFSMLVGRAFLGLAVAGIMVSSTTLIADYYQGEKRSSFMGLQAAFMSLGGVVFLSLGGAIAELNWRSPFLIYLFAWLLLPIMLVALYEPSHTTVIPTDHVQLPQVDQMPIKLLGLICGSALLLQIVFYMIPVQLPFYLAQLSGAGAAQSGLAIALATLFGAIASINYSRIKQRLSYFSILGLGFLLLGMGYCGIGLVGNYLMLLVALVPVGFGLGLLTPNLNLWTTSNVPAVFRGRALGWLTTCLFLGQFLSPIITQFFSQTLELKAIYGLTGVAIVTLSILLKNFQLPICRAINSHPAPANR
ncbi:MFS transporter [filamentous cyanobacterium LEGE 11480]|uniref:MFS transporter n=1 Tax=Romeriopsis navalis LEGE 11480 TaxID=2777977 RepID=A0A928Z550_9CYAN|nr:MFS transporter [Romeriopsis navalis]MBE9033286.1 MFS transporter [Romeriopsis navalis LEGE 11480]